MKVNFQFEKAIRNLFILRIQTKNKNKYNINNINRLKKKFRKKYKFKKNKLIVINYCIFVSL